MISFKMRVISVLKNITPVLLVLSIAMSSSAQKRFLANLPTGPSVSRVNISETMLKLGMAKIPIGAVGPYMALITEPKNIEVYQCDGDEKTIKDATEAFMKTMRQNDYDELLTAEEYGVVNNIYLVFEKTKKKDEREATAMVIYSKEPRGLSIVVIHGKFNVNALSFNPAEFPYLELECLMNVMPDIWYSDGGWILDFPNF